MTISNCRGLALALAAALAVSGGAAAGEYRLGCDSCGPPPAEPAPLPFGLDWSLGLRGGFATTPSDTRLELQVLPEARLTHSILGGEVTLGGNAQISISDEGGVRLDRGALTATGTYALFIDTQLDFTAVLAETQDRPDAPGLISGVAEAPVEIDASLEGAVTRRLGLIDFTLRGSVGRSVQGETTMLDGSTLDNSAQNATWVGGGGRLALHVTPILSGFLDASVRRERYDAASPTLMAPLDNTTGTARVGLVGRWGEVLEVEGSIGLAYRDFDDDGLSSVTATLYDGRATFRPDETLALSAGLSTTLGAPSQSSGGTATVTHEASADAAYTVNPWLRLRASVGASWARTEGVAGDETGWRAGVGADYRLNANTQLSADYSYARTETEPAPPRDEQQVLLGVTFRR